MYMDFWTLMDILHRKQLIMNPMRSEKLDRFIEALNLPKNSRVIDFGCGKGEFLLRLHSLYNIKGVGIDKSPYCINESKRQKQLRAPESDIEYLLMDGKDYAASNEFDLASCMGASWIWGGIEGTLNSLNKLVKPGGLIVLGEPYWLKEPDEEYLALEGFKRSDFHSHMENVLMGDEFGLTCAYTLASDVEDWDGYETPHWWAVSEYSDRNPDDPDVPEILMNVKKNRETYLKYARDAMGWCLYVYRKPIHPIRIPTSSTSSV